MSLVEPDLSAQPGTEAPPLVTIGVPTYNRPQLLTRALGCVAAQGYANLEVIVADNCSPGTEVEQVVTDYRSRIKGIQYIRHSHNIGSLNNLLFVRNQAAGKYFMWLADDDEISSNYVSSLVGLLEANPDAATAAGHWVLMTSATTCQHRVTSHYPQKSALMRSLRYLWSTNDIFFYGLHRTHLIQQASFKGYWWFNREIVTNWAYVFLLDMVLRGRILQPEDTTVQFINHNYTSKSYSAAKIGMRGLLAHVLRRINVHYLYWEKIAHTLGYAVMPLIVFVSCLSLLREFVITARNGIRKGARRLARRTQQ